eukprot:m.362429 g.362429  ORF g.362429 m.362429 type:complete len:1241 (+) comp20493_c0_seq1:302-4024(+)
MDPPDPLVEDGIHPASQSQPPSRIADMLQQPAATTAEMSEQPQVSTSQPQSTRSSPRPPRTPRCNSASRTRRRSLDARSQLTHRDGITEASTSTSTISGTPSATPATESSTFKETEMAQPTNPRSPLLSTTPPGSRPGSASSRATRTPRPPSAARPSSRGRSSRHTSPLPSRPGTGQAVASKSGTQPSPSSTSPASRPGSRSDSRPQSRGRVTPEPRQDTSPPEAMPSPSSHTPFVRRREGRPPKSPNPSRYTPRSQPFPQTMSFVRSDIGASSRASSASRPSSRDSICSPITQRSSTRMQPWHVADSPPPSGSQEYLIDYNPAHGAGTVLHLTRGHGSSPRISTHRDPRAVDLLAQSSPADPVHRTSSWSFATSSSTSPSDGQYHATATQRSHSFNHATPLTALDSDPSKRASTKGCEEDAWVVDPRYKRSSYGAQTQNNSTSAIRPGSSSRSRHRPPTAPSSPTPHAASRDTPVRPTGTPPRQPLSRESIDVHKARDEQTRSPHKTPSPPAFVSPPHQDMTCPPSQRASRPPSVRQRPHSATTSRPHSALQHQQQRPPRPGPDEPETNILVIEDVNDSSTGDAASDDTDSDRLDGDDEEDLDDTLLQWFDDSEPYHFPYKQMEIPCEEESTQLADLTFVQRLQLNHPHSAGTSPPPSSHAATPTPISPQLSDTDITRQPQDMQQPQSLCGMHYLAFSVSGTLNKQLFHTCLIHTSMALNVQATRPARHHTLRVVPCPIIPLKIHTISEDQVVQTLLALCSTTLPVTSPSNPVVYLDVLLTQTANIVIVRVTSLDLDRYSLCVLVRDTWALYFQRVKDSSSKPGSVSPDWCQCADTMHFQAEQRNDPQASGEVSVLPCRYPKYNPPEVDESEATSCKDGLQEAATYTKQPFRFSQFATAVNHSARVQLTSVRLVQSYWKQVLYYQGRAMPAPHFFLDSRSRNAVAHHTFRLSRSNMTFFQQLLILPDSCTVKEHHIRMVACYSLLAIVTGHLTQQDRFILAVNASPRTDSPSTFAFTLGPLAQPLPLRISLDSATSFMDVFLSVGRQMGYITQLATVTPTIDDTWTTQNLRHWPVQCEFWSELETWRTSIPERKYHPNAVNGSDASVVVNGVECTISPIHVPLATSILPHHLGLQHLPQLQLNFWERPMGQTKPRTVPGAHVALTPTPLDLAADEDQESVDSYPRVYCDAVATGPSFKDCTRLLRSLDTLFTIALREVSHEAFTRLSKLYAKMRKHKQQ